jgi:hypothetical protein
MIAATIVPGLDGDGNFPGFVTVLFRKMGRSKRDRQ